MPHATAPFQRGVQFGTTVLVQPYTPPPAWTGAIKRRGPGPCGVASRGVSTSPRMGAPKRASALCSAGRALLQNKSIELNYGHWTAVCHTQGTRRQRASAALDIEREP